MFKKILSLIIIFCLVMSFASSVNADVFKIGAYHSQSDTVYDNIGDQWVVRDETTDSKPGSSTHVYTLWRNGQKLNLRDYIHSSASDTELTTAFFYTSKLYNYTQYTEGAYRFKVFTAFEKGSSSYKYESDYNYPDQSYWYDMYYFVVK